MPIWFFDHTDSKLEVPFRFPYTDRMKNKNEEIEQFIEEFGEKLRWKKLDHSNVVQVVTEMLKHKMVKEDWIKDGTQKLEREYSQGLKDNEYAAEF